jgi:Tfp pilus assembly protein PilX
MSYRNRKNEAGQAVLIVLLSLSVVLIVVLYIMSRSVSDISLSSKDQDSMRAFSAAEAGIENALVGLYTVGSSSGNTTIGDASFKADVSNFGSGQNQILYPLTLKSGDQAVFWFSRAGDPITFNGTQFKMCWATVGTSAAIPETPAILVTVYYKTNTNEYRVARAALDPNAGRSVTNKFTSASNVCNFASGEQFQFQSTVNLGAGGLNIPATATLQFATARFLYNTTTAHKIGIDASATAAFFPSQGIKVDSQGSAADANRRIEVYQLNSEVPPIFANAIYSTSDIIK